jgi:hypothetical protein
VAGHVPCPCGECGLAVDEHVARVYEAQLEVKEGAVRDAELALRKERALVRKLRGEREDSRYMDPFYADAQAVFDYWVKNNCPNAREFNGERLEHVLARLHAGYTADDLRRACDGARKRPQRGRRWTELGTICRNETNLQMFIEWAGTPESAAPGINEGPYETYRLALTEKLVARLGELRGWTADAIQNLGLGFDIASKRIVFPFRSASGKLVGLGRYHPNAEHRTGSKMLAEGSRELFPPPETLRAESIWLVEGEPDVVAMHSIGFPAVAIPGVSTWKDGWAQRFERFERVRICFDADEKGRDCAHKRQAALASLSEVSVVDLDPDREDGYDVGDLIRERGQGAATHLASLSSGGRHTKTVHRLTQPTPTLTFTDQPFALVQSRLTALDCRVKDRGRGQLEAQCPNHDDRQPSLSVTEGDDGRVLLHCHAGCEPEEVVHALGLEMKDLFAVA